MYSTDVSVDDIEIHSSDGDEEEAVFDSSSYRAFIPQLDNWERRIIRCVFGDNLESFTSSCAETSMFIEKNILVDDIQYLSSYRAMKFPDLLNQASIIHIVVLLSAHRILRYLLDEYPASKVWNTTKEGVNAIHVAAAVGDYLALRMLLKRKDVPIDKTDNLKRTPLHYAAETNLESAITLLSYDKQLLKSVDIDELTPLQFIRYEYRPVMQQFLKLHSELLEINEEDDQDSGADNKKVCCNSKTHYCNLIFRNFMNIQKLYDN
ncbi:unnamed protein product [Hymenolepis diminuta]|uniref:Uncharacterized protein n=1 Tax=Hymenolepis diminuta TaxID=6216 RepID=A0A564YYV4_HYMDI|nr:unnamed protein product [Hymenolepis diminuta]